MRNFFECSLSVVGVAITHIVACHVHNTRERQQEEQQQQLWLMSSNWSPANRHSYAPLYAHAAANVYPFVSC